MHFYGRESKKIVHSIGTEIMSLWLIVVSVVNAKLNLYITSSKYMQFTP